MRLLGALADPKQAQALADYLLAQGIPTKLLDDAAGREVWVQNEDQTEAARAVWAEFQVNPADPRFHQAKTAAAEIKKKQAEADRQWQLNFRNAYDMWGRPNPRQAPLTMILIAVSVIASLATAFGSHAGPALRWLAFTDVRPVTPAEIEDEFPDSLSPQERRRAAEASLQVEPRFHSGGLEPIAEGQVWRLVTPIFLHFSFLHLAFNMYALYGLGTIVEARRGWKWLLAFVLGVAAISNLAQFLLPQFFDLARLGSTFGGGGLFGGMSGVLYGIFGYLWMKTIYAREPGLRIPPDLVWIMLIWLVVSTGNWIVHTANSAHIIGLLCGVAVGAGPKLLRDLMKK